MNEEYANLVLEGLVTLLTSGHLPKELVSHTLTPKAGGLCARITFSFRVGPRRTLQRQNLSTA